MLEFEDFVYLDVEKTGSTTVRRFLTRYARTPIVQDDKHRPVETRDPDKLYIISCRDPLKQYLSLYLHGHSGKGRMRARLDRADKAHLYDGTNDGFAAWLELFLDPAAGRLYFKGQDKLRMLEFMGLQALRFLTLAFASPVEVFQTLHDKADVAERLKTDALYGVILKTETLIEDMKKLVTGEHAKLFDPPPASEPLLDESGRQNVSTNPGIDLKALSPDLLARVQAREWLFFDHLGYRPYVS